MDRNRLYVEAETAMAEHRWLESEKAGYDVGRQAERAWTRCYWSRFYRERFVRHLQGEAYYEELGDECYGALANDGLAERSLLSRVVQQLREGAENLDVLCWAVREKLPKDAVLRILKAVDINGRRLPPPHLAHS